MMTAVGITQLMRRLETEVKICLCDVLSAPQRCNAERSDAQHNFFTSQFIPPFLQRHRCDALPCFSASPAIIFDIAHIAFPPLLPFFLSPQWFSVQNNKKSIESHNAAMSPLATRDGHRKRKRKTASLRLRLRLRWPSRVASGDIAAL